METTDKPLLGPDGELSTLINTLPHPDDVGDSSYRVVWDVLNEIDETYFEESGDALTMMTGVLDEFETHIQSIRETLKQPTP